MAERVWREKDLDRLANQRLASFVAPDEISGNVAALRSPAWR